MSSSQKDSLQKKLKGLSISTKPTPPPTVPISVSSPTRTKPLVKAPVSSPKTPITPVYQQARRRLSVVSGAADQSRAQIDGYLPEAKRSMSVVAATGLADIAAAKDQIRRGSMPAEKPRGLNSPMASVNQNIAPAAAVFSAFASLSKVGFVPFNNGKINQDRAMINIKFDNSDSKALFGVYDGHGVKGHEVSQFCSRELPKHLLSQANLNIRPTEALTKAFHETTDSLRNSAIDCNFSGTTAVVCYVVGKKIYACNTGDSRAVLAQEQAESKTLTAVPLSIDHKPDRPEEARRIIDHKGRVHCCKGPDGMPLGPVRVWLGKQDVPGLAMTRSIGDLVASTVGVISTPEIIEREVGPSDRFMILATDGVWEFISNQEAVNIVGQCGTPEEACQTLVVEATNRWKSQEEVIDDITCIVVFFGKK